MTTKTASHSPTNPDYAFTGDIQGYESILTPEALAFLVELHRQFDHERQRLLVARKERQARFDAGELPDFPTETRSVRESEWRVAEIPADLLDRRVEITGPVDRKMVINALNSGAKVYMADFEDSHAPNWQGTLQGQVNLIDAVEGDISFDSPEGKHYELGENPATLIVRPRGWHLDEKHMLVDGKPISGSLFDFGLYFFHNARRLLDTGRGPYFYLPKLEHYEEARLWNSVFDLAERQLGVEHGSIRATILIETLPAVFQMHEILYELRDYIAGLNCGRWDYIFSYIKTLRNHPDRVLPERGQVTMNVHFLHSYSKLLIQTCHRRGAFAMGGMAPQIPIKSDPELNEQALAKVRADKEREVNDGHDGTWVAHPGLVPIAMEIFDEHMPGPNQLDRLLEGVVITQDDLLQPSEGTITEPGLRNNIEVSIQYLAVWLSGNGCVPIHHLMEDAATAEISRTQLWQWRHHGAKLDDGRVIDDDLLRRLIEEESETLIHKAGEDSATADYYRQATQLIVDAVFTDELPDFITSAAYERLA
jgi:malate synthase